MKNKKQDELVDFTTLPKINVVTSSLILNFKNMDRRFKILENIFKQPEKNLKIISREQIIEFAKEKKIYVDPEEGKKPNPKDPPIEKKEITAEELAKAAAGVIVDRSIPLMKDKKALMEKIEELKKQKEEAIFNRDNPQPVDPKAKPKPIDKKKEQPLNPEDIIIPIIDDMNTDLIIVFYNYPLDHSEFKSLEEEKVVINHIYYINETDELVEEKEEVQFDKNGKPIKVVAKDTKPSNEQLQMQKYFILPNQDPLIIYSDLLKSKQNSDKHSLFRATFFEQYDFSFKMNEENKKDNLSTFQEDYAAKMNLINRAYLHYMKWISNVLFQKFSDDERKNFDGQSIYKIIQETNLYLKDFEHISNSSILFAFCSDLLKNQRINNIQSENNQIRYEKNDVDSLFDNLEREIMNEYGKEEEKELIISNRNSMIDNNIIAEIDKQVISHIQSERMSESEIVEKNISQLDDLSTPFKLIIDENDLILKSSIQNKIEGISISEREKEMQIFLNFPGIGRHLMPTLAPIEENRRKAIKCEIYPFLEEGITIPIYEKLLILKRFEQMMKEKVPEQNFDFGNRIYQEIMNRDILTQTINYASIYDTECAYMYNERDDNLILATYYRTPKGRLYRKTNKTRYLSKPDFENWVKFFKPTFNLNPTEQFQREQNNISNNNINNNPSTPNTNNKVGTPSNLIQPNVVPTDIKPSIKRLSTMSNPNALNFGIPYDQEAHTLYEADDTCIGEVSEKIKYMFPSDNGVFIRKIIQNGIFSSHSSYVVKDNLVFGIRKNNDNVTELWIRFENDVTLTCNYLEDYDPYLIGSDTPPNFESEKGTFTTISYKNGLNVQIMPDGDICQKIYQQDENNESRLSKDELYRIITSKASVVRYFPLEKTLIMFSNGNVCNIQNGLATNTNNKGHRLAKRLSDDSMFEIDPIPITIQSDPETNTKTLIRDDKVVNIKYPDKSQLTIHSDETKIYSYPNNLKYLIEHEDYASTEIIYDPVKKRTMTTLSDSDALLGHDNIMTRSFDGRLSKITLPDKTVVYTLKEKKNTDEFDKYSFNTVTIIYRPDGTVIRVQQDGDICIISSNERNLMNQRGQNLNMFDNKDVDYFFELNGKPEERKRGCYTVNMKKSKIWTRDDEDNLFEIHSDGSTKCKMKVTLDLQNSQIPIDEMRPVTPKYDTPDYIDDEARFCDAPQNFINPRLFVVENDNTGYELLNENQISNFKIIKAKDTLHSKYFTQAIEDNFVSHYWLTKYQSIKELIKETQIINSIKIPRKLEKITQTPITLKFPQHEVFFYRNLIESQTIEESLREKVQISINNKDQWFQKRKLDFGVLEKTSHIPELQENAKIQRRILEERQHQDLKFDYDGLIENLTKNEEVRNIMIKDNPSILFDIEDHVHQKELKKIIEDRQFRILPMRSDYSGTIQELLGMNQDDKMKRKVVIDTKALQEIKFLNNFCNSEWAKQNSYGNSNAAYEKSKNGKRKEKGMGRSSSNHFNNEDLLIEVDRPDGLEAVLSKMQMKSIYNDEMNTNNQFNPTQLSPIVILENEKTITSNQPYDPKKSPKRRVLPSIYKMKIEKIKEMKEKEKNEAEVWISSKNYKFGHDGRSERLNNPKVPNYLKTTFPEAEFNEDYIYIEKLTDKRLKTSSVAKRLYFNAPSVNDIRKSGQHNFLSEALDKKKTYEEMMERLNLMISSELCDPLNKMLKVDPISLDFGYLKVGCKYQMFIRLRNDDNMTNRIQVRKNMSNKNINVESFIGGKITPGETKKVKVTIEADSMMIGKLTEIIEIQTKSFNYKIPVGAIIVSPEDYEKLNEEKYIKTRSNLTCNADTYKRDLPQLKSFYSKQSLKMDEIKEKKFPEIFDPTPYLKYLEKTKESQENSMMSDENKLPII